MVCDAPWSFYIITILYSTGPQQFWRASCRTYEYLPTGIVKLGVSFLVDMYRVRCKYLQDMLKHFRTAKPLFLVDVGRECGAKQVLKENAALSNASSYFIYDELRQKLSMEKENTSVSRRQWLRRIIVRRTRRRRQQHASFILWSTATT